MGNGEADRVGQFGRGSKHRREDDLIGQHVRDAGWLQVQVLFLSPELSPQVETIQDRTERQQLTAVRSRGR